LHRSCGIGTGTWIGLSRFAITSRGSGIWVPGKSEPQPSSVTRR